MECTHLSDQYADTNELTIDDTAQRIVGIGFWKKNNRLAPQIYVVNLDGSGGQWIKNDEMNGEYFGSLKDQYADTNPLYVPTGKIITGFAFWQKRNRLAPKIRVSNPDGSGCEWIKNDYMNGEYFGSLKDQYADTNKLILSQSNQVFGFRLYHKCNRVAPGILL